MVHRRRERLVHDAARRAGRPCRARSRQPYRRPREAEIQGLGMPLHNAAKRGAERVGDGSPDHDDFRIEQLNRGQERTGEVRCGELNAAGNPVVGAGEPGDLLEAALRTATQEPRAPVVVDMSDTDFLACCGISVLDTTRATLADAGLPLVVTGARGSVRRLLNVVNGAGRAGHLATRT
jgi:hypothetical protein